jgi:hypothetical protein
MERMPVTLSDEDFLLLYEYFAESFGTIVDNSRMAEVIKMGYQSWARMQEIAKADERFADLPGDQIDAMRARLEAKGD